MEFNFTFCEALELNSTKFIRPALKLDSNGKIKNVFDDAAAPFIGCEFDLRMDYAFMGRC